MTIGAAPCATTVATAWRMALRFEAGSASVQARSPPSTAVIAPGKIGAADVEIDVLEVGRIARDRLADGFRRGGAIGPDRGVRGRAGSAEDRDLGFQRCEIPGPRQAEERLGLAGAEHRADTLASGHRMLPFSQDRPP